MKIVSQPHKRRLMDVVMPVGHKIKFCACNEMFTWKMWALHTWRRHHKFLWAWKFECLNYYYVNMLAKLMFACDQDIHINMSLWFNHWSLCMTIYDNNYMGFTRFDLLAWLNDNIGLNDWWYVLVYGLFEFMVMTS